MQEVRRLLTQNELSPAVAVTYKGYIFFREGRARECLDVTERFKVDPVIKGIRAMAREFLGESATADQHLSALKESGSKPFMSNPEAEILALRNEWSGVIQSLSGPDSTFPEPRSFELLGDAFQKLDRPRDAARSYLAAQARLPYLRVDLLEKLSMSCDSVGWTRRSRGVQALLRRLHGSEPTPGVENTMST